ncbi:gas vesicle protein [Brevibacillus dissolubilis]|uniref:gas vesicle protein n=1 Tax=Brevibacillus dissolubilis TaxID=1844116 RepID=UPI001117481B|nr:gas vesicle protein [Brevibacillus dissolubilis]
MAIQHSNQSSTLIDVLDKILDKGLVIAGDIKISVADVDLLSIKIRLLVASVDKAKEIGLDWWERDPYLSSKATTQSLEKENAALLARMNRLEQRLEQQLEEAGSENVNRRFLLEDETRDKDV